MKQINYNNQKIKIINQKYKIKNNKLIKLEIK